MAKFARPALDMTTPGAAASAPDATTPAPTPVPAPIHAGPMSQVPADAMVAGLPSRGLGRIPITKVSPVVECGAYPAKAVAGELFPVTARVFREGHDAVNANVVLTSPDGTKTSTPMVQIEPWGLDIWEAWVRAEVAGDWTFRVEAWSDPWATWLHNAQAKLPIAQDVPLVCLEVQRVLGRGEAQALEDGSEVDAAMLKATSTMLLPARDPAELLETLNQSGVRRAMVAHAPRDFVTPTVEFPLRVDRERALFSAWYEFFPRSQGAHQDGDAWVSGTFDSSHERLEAAAAMGFDIVYLPPIHPIGGSHRKGRNNSLTPAPSDPGSPWAIGGAAGGHDAIHPDLGDMASFERFVAKAKELGLEVALDFALQASPDHPWVTEHPEWFTTRLDGTIAYAENPPKKYQDIYPINFDTDPAGIYAESLRLLHFWAEKGVTIFRVDNPHTKPLQFWGWIMRQMRATHPDVVFLAEAFTRPEMMHALGKIGFHQSYTYFTWRNTKEELEEYLGELSTEMAPFYRPSFWVNTPDINPTFTQSGAPSAFAIRAILAATLSPSWGVYSGFELYEHEPLRQGGEEYLNSEKFEYRPRNFRAPSNLSALIGTLNSIRHRHPALRSLRTIRFHPTNNSEIIAFTKADGEDRVLVVCSLNPHSTVEGEVYLDLDVLGLPREGLLRITDEITGAAFTWGSTGFVRLPPDSPAHVASIGLA